MRLRLPNSGVAYVIPRPGRRAENPKLPAAKRAELAKEVDGPNGKTTAFALAACSHCGGLHLHACPRVKRLVFDPTGSKLVEVEFWRDSQWPRDGIIFPEDVFTDDV